MYDLLNEQTIAQTIDVFKGFVVQIWEGDRIFLICFALFFALLYVSPFIAKKIRKHHH